MASSGCGDFSIFKHLNTSNHSFNNEDSVILDRESRWFERGVKEVIYVNREGPLLNREGGLCRWRGYSAAIKKIP